MSDAVWTFGSSEGNSCDVERTFAWCNSGKLLNAIEVVNEEYWDVIPDGNISNERCIALDLDSRSLRVDLKRVDCQGTKPFICQVMEFVDKEPLLKFTKHLFLYTQLPGNFQPTCNDGNCPLISCRKNVIKIVIIV